MSTFTFLVEIRVTNDMQRETGEDFAKQELEGDLQPLPHSWRILECTGEDDDDL